MGSKHMNDDNRRSEERMNEGEPGDGPVEASMILAELVYERVRASVNLCQLVIMEQELEESIQRAMAESDRAVEMSAALARVYIQRAWDRVQTEWSTLREDLGGLAGARNMAGAAASGNAGNPGRAGEAARGVE